MPGTKANPLKWIWALGRSEVCRRAAGGQTERANHQQRHGGDLGDGEDVLHQAAEPDADVVDCGQQDDQGCRQALGPDLVERRDVADKRHVQGPRRQAGGELGQLDELRGILGEDVSDGGDGAALHDGEGRPAVKESEERTIHALEINVLAAGFRDHAGNLSVGERAE